MTVSLAHAPVQFTSLAKNKTSGEVGFKIFTGAAKNWLRASQSFERKRYCREKINKKTLQTVKSKCATFQKKTLDTSEDWRRSRNLLFYFHGDAIKAMFQTSEQIQVKLNVRFRYLKAENSLRFLINV